jgi:hypothetical protein
LLRFFVAWGAFAEHGANVWVFGIIDVGTAWPYAKSVAQVCRRAAASQWSRLPLPFVVAIATFVAPYAYLWFAAGRMPAGLRVGMSVCVSVLLVAAGVGALSKTRKLRRLASETHTAETVIDATVIDETAIDLRVVEGAREDDVVAETVIDLRVSDGCGDGDVVAETVVDLRAVDAAGDGDVVAETVSEHRVHDGPTELLIDLTTDDVSLERLPR